MNDSDNFPPPKKIETFLLQNDFHFFFPVCRVFSISCAVFFVWTFSSSWVCVCVRHLWFWKKAKIEERRKIQKCERRHPLRHIREFIRYQEGHGGENVTQQWLRLFGNFSARDYRNLLTLSNLLSWSWIHKKNVQVKKEKDKFVVFCLRSPHKKSVRHVHVPFLMRSLSCKIPL